VGQFRQPHNVFPRFRQVCDKELPELSGRLADAGCPWVDPLGAPAFGGVLPPSLPDREPRHGDAAFRMVTGRRPVVEAVIAAVAAGQPGVVIRRGMRATGLIGGPSAIPGVPHVAGVCTSAGEQLRADLVVDAMGRRSGGAGLLTELGARPPRTESETSGFAYYTRYFTGPCQPVMRGPVLTPLGTISVLTLYGDNGTWSVTVYAQLLRRTVRSHLGDPAGFARAWDEGTERQVAPPPP
jgi:2-polyprenyl-6-methoxyphenol hydroxylase-like FAD-dependent oxidoreductase